MTVLAGQIILADHINDLTVASASAEVTNNSPTMTSATYTSIGTQCGTAFTAPASGKVMISWFSELNTSVAGSVTACTIEVRAGGTVGSGTVVVAAADTLPLARGDDIRIRTPGAFHPVTGLTPGTTYNTRLMFRSDGTNTLTAGRRGVRVTGWV